MRLPWSKLAILNRSFSKSSKRFNLQVEEVDGLRNILMNDSKTRNALSVEMMGNLIEAIERDKSNVNLRTIVIKASDGPVFCAGHNLKELTTDQGIEAQKAVFAKCTELMLCIRKAEVPVIAVVKSQLAAAAGCQLVAACDFAVSTDKSTFSTPGANFGVFCTTPGISVSRSINRSLAAYMVLTGLPLSAQEALQAGLVSKVVTEDTLDAAVMHIHSSIKSKSRPIIKLGKQFFYKQLELPYEEAMRQGSDIMVKNLQLTDSQEGLSSFKEKRKPEWGHKDN